MHYIQGRGIGQKEQEASKLTLSLFERRVRYTFENEITDEVEDKQRLASSSNEAKFVVR